MKKTLAALAAFGAVGLAALPAAAAVSYPAGGVTASEVAAVLKSKGLQAEITTDDVGDPMIKSASEQINWRVIFYGCEKGRCTSIQFQAGFDLDNGMTYAKANEWNYTKRFGRAALDDDMDPYVRFDIDVEKGYNSEALDNQLATWLALVPTFADFIGFNK